MSKNKQYISTFLYLNFFVMHYEQGKLLFILLHFPHTIMQPANFSINCWSQHAKTTPNFSERETLFCSTCSSIISDFQSRMNPAAAYCTHVWRSQKNMCWRSCIQARRFHF